MSRVSRVLWLVALWGCSEGAPSTAAPDAGSVAPVADAATDAEGAVADTGATPEDGGGDTRAQTLTRKPFG